MQSVTWYDITIECHYQEKDNYKERSRCCYHTNAEGVCRSAGKEGDLVPKYCVSASKMIQSVEV